eukprot:gnl/TRDRNA2_/TRDRNA2_176231_c1_seq4.p1 gnl/TRDRNA2_/TRDRNA2_176231_c1~~gnl/TRDRNA2_/TRDRNA2_176231_c1_seq4.p1  ORF type:complete len:143 (-),score=17.63 gnl/TRDRNA2_/TRDRNA2_176231_c1_seq4:249-677(-)
MGCQSSVQTLRQAPKEIEQKNYQVKDQHHPGGTRDVPKLEGSIENSALRARRRRSKELSQGASQTDGTDSKSTENSTISTIDSDPRVPANSEMECLTAISMKSFVRMMTTATCAEEAHDGIVACEESSAVIMPKVQSGRFHG